MLTNTIFFISFAVRVCHFECGCGWKFLNELELKTHRNMKVSPLCLEAYFVNIYANEKHPIDKRNPALPLEEPRSDAGKHFEYDVSKR